jgi:hypothetical protein
MRTLLLTHIAAGGLGLLSGYVALSATKGAPLHRRVGMLFVCVMSVMAVTGAAIALLANVAPAINVPSGVLTTYLVLTSLATVKPRRDVARWLDAASVVGAASIAVACLALAAAVMAGGGRDAGLAYPLVLFAGVSVAAAAGDLRVLRHGPVQGRRRLFRHLWRMCFALFIASIAFYLGPGRVPEMLRIPVLLATAVLLPVAAIAVWQWRLRDTARRAGRVVTGTPATADPTG